MSGIHRVMRKRDPRNIFYVLIRHQIFGADVLQLQQTASHLAIQKRVHGILLDDGIENNGPLGFVYLKVLPSPTLIHTPLTTKFCRPIKLHC